MDEIKKAEEQEEIKTEETEESGNVVKKGIVLYHNENDELSYQLLQKVTLQDLSYYRRYLDKLEDTYWNKFLSEE